MDLRARLERFAETDLYVVITQAFCQDRNSLDILDQCLEAGVRLVQFREKDLESGAMYARCMAFREHTARAGALLIVNDRLDIALATGADGVHLGQSDLPVAAARKTAPDLIVGASSHNLEEALAAQEAGAGYVNIGPIYPTQTKDHVGGAVGPEMLDAVTPHLHIPFTCMGGIKADNVGPLVERGARHPAVVTAVTAAPDPAAAAAELRRAILA